MEPVSSSEREERAQGSGGDGKDRSPARSMAERYGAHTPSLPARAAISLGRLLPTGPAGLRMAGALKPFALSGKPGPRDVEAFGLKLRLHPHDNLTEKRLLLTPQCVDPEELDTLRTVMGPGRTFIDIGANSGLYSLVAAQAGGPKSSILAVEPQAEMRRRMAHNARLNGLDNIQISGVALSDYEGEDVLRIVSENRGGTRLLETGGGDGEAVRVRKLTALLAGYGWTRIDIMKIDVEGDEWRILKPFFADADRSLFPRRIIMERFEVNGMAREDTVDPMPRLAQLGYVVERDARRNVILALPDTAAG